MRCFLLKSNTDGYIGHFTTYVSENELDDDKVQELIAEAYYSCGNNQVFLCHLKNIGIYKLDVEEFYVD